MEKPLLCGKTAKDYKFWDNLMHHYKNLYPLYDKKVDFKQYTSVHDGWLFSNSKTLKLHNKVCNFEQTQATEVEKRVNLDNPDWVHPCNRRDERYLEDDHELGSMPNPDDLPAIPRPPPKNVPEYYGWTHSENADSWFLEAHTPSLHEDYEGFYDEALKKRVICPKFYSCVA